MKPTLPASLLISMCIALVNVIVDTLSILYKAKGMETAVLFQVIVTDSACSSVNDHTLL